MGDVNPKVVYALVSLAFVAGIVAILLAIL